MLTFPSHSLNSLIIVSCCSSCWYQHASLSFHLNSSQSARRLLCQCHQYGKYEIQRSWIGGKNPFEVRVLHSIFISRCFRMLYAWLSWMISRISYFLLESISIPFGYFLFQQSRMTAQIWRQVLEDMRVCKSYDLMMTSHWRNKKWL